MNFKRARSEDQIRDRKKEIMDATSFLYDRSGYGELSFSAISEYTKFTRPNIYKYFKTKEEILLEILKEDIKSFIITFTHSFKLNKLYSLDEIADIWTSNLLKHERFLNIYSILFTSIEKNVSLSALTEFKKESITLYNQLVDCFSQLFPEINERKLYNSVSTLLVLACGLYSMNNLSNIQTQALKLSGLEYTIPDFSSTYVECCYQQLYCLKHTIELPKE